MNILALTSLVTDAHTSGGNRAQVYSRFAIVSQRYNTENSPPFHTCGTCDLHKNHKNPIKEIVLLSAY